MSTFVTILYCLPVYQCLVIAMMLITGIRNRTGNSRLIMGLFQFLLAFYFTFNLLYRLKAFNYLVYVYFLILPVIILLIPVFYIYILSITTPSFQLTRKYLVHFIPSGILMAMNIPYLLFPYSEKIQYISHGANPMYEVSSLLYLVIVYIIGIYGICNAQLIYYLFKVVKVYRKHKLYIENHFSYIENINLNWIRTIIVAFIGFFILNNILYIVGFNQQLISQLFYSFSILLITLLAGIQALRQKEINPVADQRVIHKIAFLDNPNSTGEVFNVSEFKVSLETHKGNTIFRQDFPEHTAEQPALILEEATFGKYSGSALNAEQKQVLAKNLEHLMKSEKIFTDENLSVEHVAQRLDTNSKYISQIINEFFKKNFYNYVNTYRIEEAKKLILEASYEKYSILGIAHMVGFVSKSTFNSAFKRLTGLTPSAYKSKHNTRIKPT